MQAPNRNSNYHEEEIDEETYDASESNRFLFHSKEPSISENRDSVHTNFYGRMNQVGYTPAHTLNFFCNEWEHEMNQIIPN